ncbi:MAG: isocitrate/isopropylmalate family dehydrogenase [Myxococcaceae bacterium]
MLLETLGHTEEAHAVENALEAVLEDGKGTKDIGGALLTSELTTAVLDKLRF